jgi:hypothetical protein
MLNRFRSRKSVAHYIQSVSRRRLGEADRVIPATSTLGSAGPRLGSGRLHDRFNAVAERYLAALADTSSAPETADVLGLTAPVPYGIDALFSRRA